MRKKLLSVTLVVVMIFSCSILSFAKEDNPESNGKITRDTVITKDNLNDILKLYGIDHNSIKPSDMPNKKVATTVGQLEDAINYIKENSKTDLTIDETISNSNLVKSGGIISPMATPITGSTRLTRTTNPTSSYSMNYAVNATYTKDQFSGYKSWTGTNSPSVTISDHAPNGAKNVLNRVNSISATFTSSTVTLNSEAVVDFYLVIGIEGTPFSIDVYQSSNTITSKINWDSSYIP